jgi:hypothetical protein
MKKTGHEKTRDTVPLRWAGWRRGEIFSRGRVINAWNHIPLQVGNKRTPQHNSRWLTRKVELPANPNDG